MNNAVRKSFYFLLFLIIALSFSACAPKSIENTKSDGTHLDQNNGTGAVSNQTSGDPAKPDEAASKRDLNYTTSLETAKIAYEEAKKWNPDSVLLSMTVGTDLAVHYDWVSTGLAFSWTADFVSPSKDEMIFVYVRNGKVDNTMTKTYEKSFDTSTGYPADKPLIPMEKAIQTVIANGGVKGLMPANIYYDVAGYHDNTFPYWSFSFKVPLSDGAYETHFYYVNAKTGEFADAYYKNSDGDEIQKGELTEKRTDLSDLALMQDQRYTVIKFMTLINENAADAAVAMMDETASPDSQSREMWISSLASIKGFSFPLGGFYEEDKENWTDDMQRFEIKIVIPDSCNCEQYGWEHGNNTRWITLKKYGGEWKVHEISTSP